MVRFKNRYLLVEFLVPSAFSSSLQFPSPSLPSLTEEEAFNFTDDPQQQQNDDEDDDEDEDEFLSINSIPRIPFLIPSSKPILGIGDESSSQQVIYKAIRGVIQDIFGDEGWARVASSFRIIYHSPITTLTFIRIARPYYRLIWSGLTFLNNLNGKSIIPRVIGVSGTIRKLQNRGVVYHRLIVAQLINHVASSSDESALGLGNGERDRRLLEKESEREREEIGRLVEG